MIWMYLWLSAHAWPEKGPEGTTTGREWAASEHFSAAELPASQVVTDPAAIAAMCRSMLAYLEEGEDPWEAPGALSELGITAEQQRQTLEKLAHLAETEPLRLSDPAFLAEHFQFYRWTPAAEDANRRGIKLAPGELRLTKYLIYRQPGSSVPTDAFPYALYAVPGDEAGLTEEQAASFQGIRQKYTRPQVFAGALANEPQAPPLVWLTQEGVIQAMLQGTVEVQLPEGPRLFNVHRHNGIPYDRSIKDGKLQPRYWYFREVEGARGWGSDPSRKVRVHDGVAVAGDVYNLGLGTVVLLEAPTGSRLAVLADTGGAFQPNGYQLDYFAGTFDSEAQFYRETRAIPDRVRAGVLVARSGASSGR